MDDTIFVNIPVGPSGCGKSSLAIEQMHIYPDLMIVSKDKIREMFYGQYAYKHNFEDVVSAAEKEIVWTILRNGNSVFIDEVNATLSRREYLLTIINKFRSIYSIIPPRSFKVVGWYFRVGEKFVDTLIQKRFKENKGIEAERWKKIIMDQVATLVPPTKDEGFDEIRIIDRDRSTDQSFAKTCYKRQLEFVHSIKHTVMHVFVPESGVCASCGENIWTVENVQRSYDTLITGCPHCGWSFCE